MVRYLTKFKLILALLVVVVLVIFLASACNIGGGPDVDQAPAALGILTPPENTVALVGGPVQIQSAFANADTISRVELRVRKPDGQEDLLRSDVPSNGLVLQEWTPPQEGTFTIRVVAYDASNQIQKEESRQLQARALAAITLPREASAAESVIPPAAFQPSTPTPAPEPAATQITAPRITPVIEAAPEQAAEFAGPVVVVAMAEEAEPEPTPIRRFPPPPPAPGVPPGPTQDKLPAKIPPVCDAAVYLGPFTANTARRITATAEDDVPIITVGGALVHRAWRLQNVGTCTWGPGYELSFYGGRAMGSGGVAFESAYPAEPGRRNVIIEGGRLIVPEGKPNQVAVAEVLLNVPPIPGIHQSYWRMRNPQGVYFGPIVGVTFEVVRECDFGILGAPVINKFEILGVGEVFRPDSPTEVQARFGDSVTLDWDIISTTNFDVVLEDPTGTVSTLSNTDPRARAQFRVTELGEYIVTIFADNGPCTVSESVTIDVVPRAGDLFELDIILSPTSASANRANADVSASADLTVGDIVARWRHVDEEADEFTLTAQLYQNVERLDCPLVDSIFGWRGHCSLVDNWRPVSGLNTRQAVTVGNEPEGRAQVSNVESNLCRGRVSNNRVQFGIRYVLRAEKDGQPASPEFSNTVDTLCGAIPSPGGVDGQLPAEIESQKFDPN